jgi:hypothetical protein
MRTEVVPTAEIALFTSDVLVVDAATGDPVNTTLSLSGSIDMPRRTEQDHATGRCRITRVGRAGENIEYRITADGYAPATIDVAHISELTGNESIGGILDQSTITMMPTGGD